MSLISLMLRSQQCLYLRLPDPSISYSLTALPERRTTRGRRAFSPLAAQVVLIDQLLRFLSGLRFCKLVVEG